MYGIYDLSGGLWEWTAGYINTKGNYENYGKNLLEYSNKYSSKYNYFENGDTETLNYNANNNEDIKRSGEALWETSTSGTGTTSWNSNDSYFANKINPFLIRGGYYGSASNAGIFGFSNSEGYCDYNIGFRAVLIVE